MSPWFWDQEALCECEFLHFPTLLKCLFCTALMYLLRSKDVNESSELL